MLVRGRSAYSRTEHRKHVASSVESTGSPTLHRKVSSLHVRALWLSLSVVRNFFKNLQWLKLATGTHWNSKLPTRVEEPQAIVTKVADQRLKEYRRSDHRKVQHAKIRPVAKILGVDSKLGLTLFTPILQSTLKPPDAFEPAGRRVVRHP